MAEYGYMVPFPSRGDCSLMVYCKNESSYIHEGAHTATTLAPVIYAKSHRESAITATLCDLAVFDKKKKREIPGRMKKINTDCDPRV